MKNLILLLLLFPISLFAQFTNYTLKGKIGNVNAPLKVYLTYSSPGFFPIDSTTIKDGKFEFKQGGLRDPMQATLLLSSNGAGPNSRPSEYLAIYLEPGAIINLSSPDSLVNAIITGSKINSDYEKLKDALKATDKKLAITLSAFKNLSVDKKKDTAVISDFIKQRNSIIEQQKKIKFDFIKDNPNSWVSLDLLKEVSRGIDYTVLSPLFNSLSPDLKNTTEGKRYAKGLEAMNSAIVGAMAPQFTQNDPDGKPIKLSSFQGKYLLVDFWASWCAPCRAENPNVVKAYNKYHNKGLEILGVSLDKADGKNAWIAAIKKDGLPWNHVSDLKGWRNEAVILYDIHSVPQNLLLDKQGKIIAKNLYGEDLNKKLEEIFK